VRILLVEDEHTLADALVYILKKNNYLVDVAYDGITGQDLAETGTYDLIILDRMLPGKEGVEILKYLRKLGIKSTVIFMTARDTVANKVEGLDAGADDYLVKPFSTDELLARVRSLGRRLDNRLTENKISISSLCLNPLRCEAYSADETISLSVKESQLLELLIRNLNQVLTKELILDRVWGCETDVEISIVEIYIHYLRKKINFDKCRVSLNTIRGIGYCLKGIENV
jgi:DNA-binding response OmpR family regulator